MDLSFIIIIFTKMKETTRSLVDILPSKCQISYVSTLNLTLTPVLGIVL